MWPNQSYINVAENSEITWVAFNKTVHILASRLGIFNCCEEGKHHDCKKSSKASIVDEVKQANFCYNKNKQKHK